MEYIKLFENFEKHYGSAGIVFIYNEMVLLVHASNRSFGTWSYPKGRLDKGEQIIDAAIREVEEEIGVSMPKEKIEKLILKEAKPVQKYRGVKHYWYYTYNLTEEEFQYYFDGKYVMDVNKLQIKEIDQARFFTKKEAKKVLPKKFREILEY